MSTTDLYCYEAYIIKDGVERCLARGDTQDLLAKKMKVSSALVRRHWKHTMQGKKLRSFYVRKTLKPKHRVYAAYELKSGYELCLGVADTMAKLGEMLGISTQAVAHKLEQNRQGVPCRDFYVMEVVYDTRDEE